MTYSTHSSYGHENKSLKTFYKRSDLLIFLMTQMGKKFNALTYQHPILHNPINAKEFWIAGVSEISQSCKDIDNLRWMWCNLLHSSFEHFELMIFYSPRHFQVTPNKTFSKTQIPLKSILRARIFAMMIQILHFIVYYHHKFLFKKEHLKYFHWKKCII